MKQRREFRLHPFSLCFQEGVGHLEEGFRNQDREVNVLPTRTIILIAALLFSSFGFYDVTYNDPALVRRLLMIRFVYTVPVLLAFAYLVKTEFYKKHQNLFLIFMTGFISFSLTWTSLSVRQSVDHTNFAAVIIFYMGSILVFRPRFIPGIVVGVFMFGIFILGDLAYGLYEPLIRMKVIMFMFSGFMIGSAACYILEYAERERYYLMSILLEEQKQEIEIQRLKTIRTIARTVAHEFNNPLGAILGAYDYGVRPNLGEFNEKARDLIVRIPNSVRRMESLVNQLLNVTEVMEKDYISGMPMLDLSSNAKYEELGREVSENDE